MLACFVLLICTQLLLTKSLLFAVPGVCVGLFISFLLNIPVATIIGNFSSMPAHYDFFPSAVIIALLIGLIMPFIANIVPISRALSHTLRDSLDVYHHVINDVIVKVIKLAEYGLDIWYISIVSYCILPSAFCHYVYLYVVLYRLGFALCL